MTPGPNRVSVIVATYNRGGGLRENLDSVLNQDYENFEVIYVDDSSTDITAQILEEYVASHPQRLNVVRVPNGGQGMARNAGAQAATGSFLFFTDDDVIVPSNWISHLMDVFARCGCDAVSGGFAPYSLKTPAERYLHYRQCVIHGDTAKQIQVAPMMSFLVPKALFLEVGGFIRDPIEDWVFCQELTRRGKRIWYDPTVKVVHHYQTEWAPAIRRIKTPAIRGVYDRADRAQWVFPYVVYSTFRAVFAPLWCLRRYPLDTYPMAVWVEAVFIKERWKAYLLNFAGKRLPAYH